MKRCEELKDYSDRLSKLRETSASQRYKLFNNWYSKDPVAICSSRVDCSDCENGYCYKRSDCSSQIKLSGGSTVIGGSQELHNEIIRRYRSV